MPTCVDIKFEMDFQTKEKKDMNFSVLHHVSFSLRIEFWNE